MAEYVATSMLSLEYTDDCHCESTEAPVDEAIWRKGAAHGQIATPRWNLVS